MCTIQYLCVHYNLYVYTTISMCTLQFLCALYNPLCTLQSQWFYIIDPKRLFVAGAVVSSLKLSL